MGKIQPNFSFQKYEGKPEDQKEQFQHQLQQQHIVVSNSVNTTIDDLSYWTRERPTAFTWVDGRQVYTQTFVGTLIAPGDNATPHNIVGLNKVISITGEIQDAIPLAIVALPLPWVDVSSFANCVSAFCDTVNYYIVSNNGLRNGYKYSLTLTYTKT